MSPSARPLGTERTLRPSVALVLATFNRAAPLERLLHALERQTLPREDWEVIVAVDGSTDDTEQVLARWVSAGTLPLQFLVQENAGQSVARHNGILRAQAEHVIVIDDDMEVCPAFVEEHLAASRTAPGKVVVVGKVVPEKTFMKKPLFTAVGEHHLLLLHDRMESGEQPPTATAFVTQNVSFPRAMYLEVGGFDASLRLDEDRELGIRMEREGAVFVFAPKAWAIHHSDVGSYDKWSRRHYDYGKYALQIWEKHGESPLLHPLRNFVDGSRLNRALVKMVCSDDLRSKVAESTLRWMGNALQRLGILQPAIYTHKAIQAVRYHQGLRDALGSWGSLRRLEREYVASPERPRAPTGSGLTYKGPSPSG
jgi:glycosyltransferase involved in cell wall biosynthesis